jgi:hypothetical protein
LKNAVAHSSFEICLERQIGVHQFLLLAAKSDLRFAQQCHQNGLNDCGICLEYGRDITRHIEMATEYYKFAIPVVHEIAVMFKIANLHKNLTSIISRGYLRIASTK